MPTNNQVKKTEIDDELDESEKAVVVEVRDNEFYTPEELDEIDKSMAYLARKFLKIRFKKPRSFKRKMKGSYSNNSYKGKNARSSISTEIKNGYKIGYVDRSKIRCFTVKSLGILQQNAESLRR